MTGAEIILSWTEFKSYLLANLVPFKQLNRGNNYYLFLADGALTATCLIAQDGGADQTDYEANYQSRANKTFAYYATPINIRQSATTAANATIFAMRNALASTRKVVIEKILLSMAFDTGTPLGRSLQRYNIVGFNTATPTGGSAQSASPTDNSNPASQVTDIRAVDTGLTTTGLAFGSTLATVGCPATDATVAPFVWVDPKIVLSAGEGLAIRLGATAVVGEDLTGFILWSER